MDDDKEKPRNLLHETTLCEAFPALDFSNIRGFPNECYDHEKLHDILPEFRGNDGVSATHHVASLCKLMSDFNVHHEDDIMFVFAITLEGDADNWFYNLPKKSIGSLTNFFEIFLLRWHDGIVDEIEQLAEQYDALIPRIHLEKKEQQHEIDNPIEEASEGLLFKDIAEELLDIVITENDMELPQIYVIENIFQQLHEEKVDLPQVHVIDEDSCFKDQCEQFYDENSGCPQIYVTENTPDQLPDLPQDYLIEDNSFTSQHEQIYGGDLYLSPISQWIEDSCLQSDLSYQSFNDFLYPNSLILQFKFIYDQILRYPCLVMTPSTILSRNEHKEKKNSRDEMLEWLHWLWAYT